MAVDIQLRNAIVWARTHRRNAIGANRKLESIALTMATLVMIAALIMRFATLVGSPGGLAKKLFLAPCS